MQMTEKLRLTGLLLGMNRGPAKNHLGDKRFADDEEVETEVRKWLRQQSEYFYAAGL
jgi:hypothetical protein